MMSISISCVSTVQYVIHCKGPSLLKMCFALEIKIAPKKKEFTLKYPVGCKSYL